MAQPARPLRADAARNRARVLEVACETFAAEGLSVPIEEIARRAGVGTGTVCRHFPTKQDLVLAVFADFLAPFPAHAGSTGDFSSISAPPSATYWLGKIETKGQSIEAIDEAIALGGESGARRSSKIAS